jgi:hypothetical protein
MTQMHLPTMSYITHLNISLTSLGDLYDLTTIATSENIKFKTGFILHGNNNAFREWSGMTFLNNNLLS